MAKGGGAESKSESHLPEWYVPYAKRSLAMADKKAQMGYMPYMGPDVAAFNPQQVAGMQQANNWAAAFGKEGQKAPSVAASLPKSQTYAGGIEGLSSFDGYNQAIQTLGKKYPGQLKYLRSFFIDPVTGKAPPMEKIVKRQMALTDRENWRTYLDRRNSLGLNPITDGDQFPGPDDGGGSDRVGAGIGGPAGAKRY